jgi:citrate lyase subunit beta/citryl-CoA lyase
MNLPAVLEFRSILFVPADAERFLAKAASRGADAIVLDLEDGVAPSAKGAARAALADATRRLHEAGAFVFVRVNLAPELFAQDLRAAVAADADGIVVPKVEDSAQLAEVDREILSAEVAQGRESGTVRVLALLETPLGVLRAAEIAKASQRLVGMCFGSEDFATAMGVVPGPEALALPAQMVAMAAVAAGLQPLGLPGSVGNFTDLAGYRELVWRAKRLGVRGATCIHPAQVTVLNEVFASTPEELAAAERLVAAFDAALREGRGSISVDGKMVDAPIADRARALLQRRR